MNNNLFLLNVGIKNQADKKRITIIVYIALGMLGVLLLLAAQIVYSIQTKQFAYNPISKIAHLGTAYIILQIFGTIFFGASLAVIPFFALPGNNSNAIINVLGWIIKIGLMIAIFVLGLYKYKPMFNYENKDNAFIQDLNFVNSLYKDSKENNIIIVNNAKINFDLINEGELIYNEIENSGYFKFTDEENNTIKIIFSKADFYKIKQGISAGKKCYDISYYSNSHIMKNINENREFSEEEKTTQLLNDLLDMDIELTIELTDRIPNNIPESVILIKRPYIPYYDDNGFALPDNRIISLYVKRNGEFYDVWDFSHKDWLNDLSALGHTWRYGDYEMTLVFGYDKSTGEYTPISNTILYSINDSDDYRKPHAEYESIPLDRSKEASH